MFFSGFLNHQQYYLYYFVPHQEILQSHVLGKNVFFHVKKPSGPKKLVDWSFKGKESRSGRGQDGWIFLNGSFGKSCVYIYTVFILIYKYIYIYICRFYIFDIIYV